MTPHRSIGSRLYMLLAATALPLVMLLGYSIYVGAQEAIATAKQSARVMAVITALDTDRALKTNREALERIAQRPLIRTAAQGRCDDFLDDFHQVFPMFANATVIDTTGVAICSAVPQPGGKPVYVGKTEWFLRAQAEQRFVVGRPFLGPITGRWVSVLIAPVRDGQGTTTAWLGFPVDLAAYRPSASGADLPPGTTIGIFDDHGTLIWRNLDPEKWVGKQLPPTTPIAAALAGEREFTGIGVDGVERVYLIEKLTEADWYVYVGIPREKLYADTWRSVYRNSVFSLLFLGLTLVLAARLARSIAGPIRRLAGAARRIKGGEVEVRVPLEGPRELVEVAREFNAMVEVREQQSRELQTREAALRATNAELEQFAYVASHDLQTPLRNVVSYCQLLERRYRGRLDSDADDFIAFIVGGATQMSRLIADLLAYARNTSHHGPLEAVPARCAVDQALSNLHSVVADEGAAVTVGNLPEVMADEMLLVSLFQNLIDNGLKYHHPERPPVITIAAEEHSPTHWRFAITDNGLGIEDAYKDKIFEMFQRIAPAGDNRGTGIGLTLCRHIVSRFGGDIWLESEPGKGSTFLFTLHKADG